MKKLAYSGIGNARLGLVAAIAMAPMAWGSYEALHANAFETAGIDKVVIVDGEGKVVSRHTNVAAATHAAIQVNSSTLRHEDFLVIQDMVTEVRRRKLNGINDLKEAGLSFPVALSDQIVGTENISEHQEAEQAMNPSGYQNNDTVYTEIYTPNPITHQSCSVPWRQQGFQYKTAAGLKENMRQVAERLEETLFNGNSDISVSFGGTLHPIYGYTNHPDRGTGTISAWDIVANNDDIVNENIDQIGSMFSDQGGVEMDSVIIYYPKNFKPAMDRDYVSGFPSKTVRERIMDIPEVKDAKFCEKLADNNVVYVEMTDRTIQLAIASDIVTIPHIKTNPMASQDMTTYAAMVQIIKVDSNGNTGIRHASV